MGNVRPIEPRDLGKRVDYSVFRWPRQLRWILGGTMLDVIWSMREDEVAVRLDFSAKQSPPKV